MSSLKDEEYQTFGETLDDNGTTQEQGAKEMGGEEQEDEDAAKEPVEFDTEEVCNFISYLSFKK